VPPADIFVFLSHERVPCRVLLTYYVYARQTVKQKFDTYKERPMAGDTLRLPFAVREAMIGTAQRAFWAKDPLLDLLRSAHVPEGLLTKYQREPKVTMMRSILQELDRYGSEGIATQQRVLQELLFLQAPHPSVENPVRGLQAIHDLRAAATAWDSHRRQADESHRQTRAVAAGRVQQAQTQHDALQALRGEFSAMVVGRSSPQQRGRDLQVVLQDLFQIHGIPYRPPTRTTTDEVDGSFIYKEMPYLVEARWRSQLPGQTDLAGFHAKVEQRLRGTRGLFVSIPGFHADVVSVFDRRGYPLLLMDGADLSLILEEQIGLAEALDLKLERAAVYGAIYFPLARR
jgi:hypothetical protein